MAGLAAMMWLGLAATGIPWTATPVDHLPTAQWRHDEALRIRRDFGEADFEIALDVWGPGHEVPEGIADVRLWWARPSRAQERCPFSARVMRHIDIDYVPETEDAWRVSLAGDHKAFEFTVEVDSELGAAAYADVRTTGGGTVEHCRAVESTLVARRFVGIPVGIDRLEVTCVDDHGRPHRGVVPYRRVRRGRRA